MAAFMPSSMGSRFRLFVIDRLQQLTIRVCARRPLPPPHLACSGWMAPGGVHGRGGAPDAAGVLPVLPPLSQPKEAHRGMYGRVLRRRSPPPPAHMF